MSKDKTGASALDGEALPAPTATPETWADLLFPMSQRGRFHAGRWKHGAANALYQWEGHAHHYGAPPQVTREFYEAAIEAACKPNPVRHDAAGKV